MWISSRVRNVDLKKFRREAVVAPSLLALGLIGVDSPGWRLRRPRRRHGLCAARPASLWRRGRIGGARAMADRASRWRTRPWPPRRDAFDRDGGTAAARQVAAGDDDRIRTVAGSMRGSWNLPKASAMIMTATLPQAQRCHRDVCGMGDAARRCGGGQGTARPRNGTAVRRGRDAAWNAEWHQLPDTDAGRGGLMAGPASPVVVSCSARCQSSMVKAGVRCRFTARRPS